MDGGYIFLCRFLQTLLMMCPESVLAKILLPGQLFQQSDCEKLAIKFTGFCIELVAKGPSCISLVQLKLNFFINLNTFYGKHPSKQLQSTFQNLYTFISDWTIQSFPQS